MKKIQQNKGITLVSLIVYIILTLIILGIISTLTMYFRRNINNMNAQTLYDTEFDKLNLQILKETKTEGNELIQATQQEMTFASGNTYTYIPQEGTIYLNNNIKIAEHITNFKIERASISEGDTMLELLQTFKIEVEISGQTRTMEYVIPLSTTTSE